MKSRLHISLWVVSFLLMLKVVFKPLSDPDLWWHLAAGREMVSSFSILKTEIFSYTRLGMEWINFEWLTEILYFLIVKVMGFGGFFAFCLLMYILCMAAVLFTLKKEAPLNILTLALFWLGFYVVGYRFDGRAGLITLLLLPIIVLLVRHAPQMSSRQQKTFPFLMFGLYILWVNMHAGVLYGLGLLFAFLLGARWSKEPKKMIKLLDRSFMWACIGFLINPFGPRYVEMVTDVLFNRKVAQAHLAEWSVPSLAQFPFFWMLLLLGTAGIVFALMNKWKSIRFWIPAFALFALWSTGQARATPLLAFVALPMIAPLLQKMKQSQIVAVALLILFVGRAASSLTTPFPNEKIKWNDFPRGACTFINKNNIDGNIVTTLRYGNYHMWACGPEKKTFMYGSYLFLPLIQELEILLNQDGPDIVEWKKFLSNYNIDSVLTPWAFPNVIVKGHPFPYSLHEVVFPKSEWALVYFDNNSLILLKRTEKYQDLIDRHEYKHLWPINLNHMELDLKNGLISREDAVQELARHRQVAGNTRVGRRLEAVLINAEGALSQI